VMEETADHGSNSEKRTDAAVAPVSRENPGVDCSESANGLHSGQLSVGSASPASISSAPSRAPELVRVFLSPSSAARTPAP
jgi:hypothetical protein